MIGARWGSTDAHRSRRKAFRDRLRTWFGRWPYRCQNCGLRFWAQGRYAPRSQRRSTNDTATNHSHNGPEMAFRTHTQKPQAKIVVQAESHEQLNHILLALNQAVSSYQHASNKQEQTAANSR